MLNLEITEKEAAMVSDIFSLIAEVEQFRNAVASVLFANPKLQGAFKAQDVLDFRNKVAALNKNSAVKEENK
jgi:hypothetical protein